MPRLPYRAERLAATLKENGWILLPFDRGFFTYEHPACQQEVATPDGVRHWYDFPTYQPLRQLSFSVDARIITTRTGTPWQGSSQQSISLPKALKFISEEFNS